MKLAVTMGDPAGIGPEVCLQLKAHPGNIPGNPELIIYGDWDLLIRVSKITGLPVPDPNSVHHIPVLNNVEKLIPGKVDASCGKAAFTYLEHAIQDAMQGVIDGIVTAPINKEALRAAGILYPGHTEILTDLTHSTKTCMLQYSKEVTASFVTCHCGYTDVSRLMTRPRLKEVIDLTHQAMEHIHGRQPRLACLGLNPHAGENGLFGNSEEQRIIIPEIESANRRGILMDGPFPPDTAFLPSNRKKYDAFICMYHDQGHIPLKALAFDNAVNVTLGLPIVRTSVDHGTAFDIAWMGQSDSGSIISAVTLATKIATIS